MLEGLGLTRSDDGLQLLLEACDLFVEVVRGVLERGDLCFKCGTLTRPRIAS